MSDRPKRKRKPVQEISAEVPRKWTDKEMETLLFCLMQYGHKNLEKIHEHLPARSIENIKIFVRTIYDRANKLTEGNESNETIDRWIDLCHSSDKPPWTDCLQIAQVIKYLSVDGLLENHPLPTSSQGIDFGSAYKLIYQALMGYPIQPVNRPTADFVIESLMELTNQVKKQTAGIVNVESFLQKKSEIKESDAMQYDVIRSFGVNNEPKEYFKFNKPLKVYQRKKPSVVTNTAEVPSLKIFIEEKDFNPGMGSLKDFSVTVEGNISSENMSVNVPVPVPVPNVKAVNQDEEELLKSSSYNPFEIPGKWLEEPFHLNLIQKF